MVGKSSAEERTPSEPGDPEGSWRDKYGRLRNEEGLAWAPDYGTWYKPWARAYGGSDPGGGAPDPHILEEYGIASRDWYEDSGVELPEDVDLSHAGLLSHWDAIETDFQREYGIDLASGILKQRRWSWFLKRLVRLLSEETALARATGLLDRREKPAE